jgi:phospholipase C
MVMGYYDGNTVTALWNYAQAFAMSDNTTSIDPNNKNIGDLLNARNVTWGWFEGGFRDCKQTHANKAGVVSKDYIPHHEPSDRLLGGGRCGQPARGLIRQGRRLSGRACGLLRPLDEQEFLVSTINRLQRTRYWKDIAVVIAYDDSDGWYDHAMGPIVNQSQDPVHDALSPAGCGTRGDARHTLGSFHDRCGYGPRQPLLVVSPFAKSNFVDHTTTDQSSILRFIEDNWQTDRIGNFSFDTKAGSLLNLFSFGGDEEGLPKLVLDPATGQRVGGSER